MVNIMLCCNFCFSIDKGHNWNKSFSFLRRGSSKKKKDSATDKHSDAGSTQVGERKGIVLWKIDLVVHNYSKHQCKISLIFAMIFYNLRYIGGNIYSICQLNWYTKLKV